jgi:hypothetical protein
MKIIDIIQKVAFGIASVGIIGNFILMLLHVLGKV